MAEAIEEGNLQEDEEDELEAIRRRRIEELKEKAKRAKVCCLKSAERPHATFRRRSQFGHLMPLTRADYKAEVTEGSKDAWVVLLLYNDAVPASRALEEVLQRLSMKHKATKFMKIKADQCIEGYPDRNVPTLLLYHNGENQRQIMGAGVYGGKRNGDGFTDDRVEWVLADEGAVETDLTEDPRPSREERAAGGSGGVYYTTESGIGFGGGAYDDREED